MKHRSTKGQAYDLAMRDVREMFADQQDKCAACWRTTYRTRRGEYLQNLETHHMIKQGRLHERCNLLRLCNRCHDLTELARIKRDDGTYWPYLKLAHCLTLKIESDLAYVDFERLEEIYRKRLPEALPVPEAFIAERGVGLGWYRRKAKQ